MPGTSYINASDELLGIALKKGNKDALSAVYDKYGACIFGMFQKVTGSEIMAEKALQSCFSSIWRHREEYNQSSERLFLWILSIAKKTAFRLIETNKSNPENQGAGLFVSGDKVKFEEGRDSTLMMELIIFGAISQEEVAKKAGISVNELRQLIRKEISKSRSISLE